MPVCSIVKLLPLSTCGRPVALLHSASYTNRHEITVYYGEVNYVNSLVPGQLLSTFAISTPLLKYRSRTQCMFQKVCLNHQSASANDKAGNICCQQATQCKYTVRHCKIILTTYNYHLHQRRFCRIYLSTNPSPHDPQDLLLAQTNRPMKTPGSIFSIIPSCQSD